MAHYVAESYFSKLRSLELEQMAVRVRAAAEELSWDGTPITYLRSFFVPEDETCLHFFEAESVDAVREASARAELECDRIAETTSVGAAANQKEEMS
jgi:hypothetical protein